jgi:hypothetical protein
VQSQISTLTEPQLTDLYESYIKKSCSNQSCINRKRETITKCPNKVCRINLITAEELVLQNCTVTNQLETSKCLKREQAQSAISRCRSTSCQENSILILKQKVATKNSSTFHKVDLASITFRNTALEKLLTKSISAKQKHKQNQKSIKLELSNKISSKNTLPTKKHATQSLKVQKKMHYDSNTKGRVQQNTSYRKEEPAPIQQFNNQDDLARKTKAMYLSKCSDKKCRDLINKSFEGIGTEVPLSEAQISEKTKKIKVEFINSSIPERLREIYLSNGPYSQSMIEFFKANSSLGEKQNFSLPKILIDCNNHLLPQECNWAKENIQTINRISNFFRKPQANTKKSEGWEFSRKIRTEGIKIKNSTKCNVGLWKGIPTKGGEYNESSGSNQGNSLSLFAFSFSDSKEGCNTQAQEDHITRLNDNLKIHGNFSAAYIIWSDEVGTGTPPTSMSYNIKGDCTGYIYTPLNTHSAPKKSWFDNNPRVRVTKKYKEVTHQQCIFEAKRNYHLLDPSRVEEFIFFNGNIPIIRTPSKLMSSRWDKSEVSTSKMTSLFSSAAACELKTSRGFGRFGRPQYTKTDENGNCTSYCKRRVDLLIKSNKKASNEYQHNDISCNLVINYSFKLSKRQEESKDIHKENHYRQHRINVYKIPNDQADESKKICKHYDYRWSNKPIYEFYAKSENECFNTGMRGMRTGSPDGYNITNKQSYIYQNYFDSNKIYSDRSSFKPRDIEIFYDKKSLYKYSPTPSCKAIYKGDIHDRIKLGKIDYPNATSKEDCMKSCKETYYPLISSSIRRESKQRVQCYMDGVLLNNIFTPSGTDPLIVISNEEPETKKIDILNDFFNNPLNNSTWYDW